LHERNVGPTEAPAVEAFPGPPNYFLSGRYGPKWDNADATAALSRNASQLRAKYGGPRGNEYGM